jgi:hypothetical protein
MRDRMASSLVTLDIDVLQCADCGGHLRFVVLRPLGCELGTEGVASLSLSLRPLCVSGHEP